MYVAVRLALCLVLTLPGLAAAATFTVSNTNDSGAGSLRQALFDARVAPSPPHSIVFSAAYPLSGLITLQSALPSWINGQLTIDGGSRLPRIDGVGAYRILPVEAGATSLTVRNLSLLNGFAVARGGCIGLLNPGQATSLLVEQSSFRNCRASSQGAPQGGAIAWEAAVGSSVTIRSSTFRENRTVAVAAAPPVVSGGTGGAIYIEATTVLLDSNLYENNFIDVGAATTGGSGGAVTVNLSVNGFGAVDKSLFRFNSATPLTTNNTGTGGALRFSCAGTCQWFIDGNYFRGNSARQGGAIWGPGSFGGSATLKTVTMTNNTFVNNDVIDQGGAVYFGNGAPRLLHNSFFGNGASAGAHLAMVNSRELRVANNLMAASNSGSACSGSGSGNTSDFLIGNLAKSTCSFFGANDFLVYPAMPDPVIDEAGLGALRFDGEPILIDSVSGTAAQYCTSVDIRGNPRPIDGNGDGLARCDVGSFEHPAAILFRNGFES